ncbi:TPA: DNA gyrase inhibitor SbmC [Citrobacter freundii]
MEYEIRQVEKRTVAGFHMVGPWEQTVAQGFAQLKMWVKGNALEPREWIAVYYDNPDVVAAEKLRCDTVIAVAENFTVPENSPGVIVTAIEGGQYAVATARVTDQDFAQPWKQFFNSLLQDNQYQMAARPCFELWLTREAKADAQDIAMHVPVQPKR